MYRLIRCVGLLYVCKYAMRSALGQVVTFVIQQALPSARTLTLGVAATRDPITLCYTAGAGICPLNLIAKYVFHVDIILPFA